VGETISVVQYRGESVFIRKNQTETVGERLGFPLYTLPRGGCLFYRRVTQSDEVSSPFKKDIPRTGCVKELSGEDETQFSTLHPKLKPKSHPKMHLR